MTERKAGLERGTGVRLIRTRGAAMAVAGTAACGVASWQAVLLALAVLLADRALWLFTEWQRRKTFIMLLKGAPAGTVIIQQDGPGGPVMTVTWGKSIENVVEAARDHP